MKIHVLVCDDDLAFVERATEKIEEASEKISKSKFGRVIHFASEMAKKLEADFGGEVPEDMELMQTLPGVGRKTANVMMAVAFGRPAMPVDTHVFRVTNRMGLASAKTPLETEKQLVAHIPAEWLSTAHHWFILHGRYVCLARKPKCEECGLSSFCKFLEK